MNVLPQFRHILVIEDQKARRIIALEEQTYSIGRESTNEIIIYEKVVSRQHATLLRIKKSPNLDNYSYRIVDGDLNGNRSTNGVVINGNNYESHDLKHGDVIYFGGKAKASYYILSNSLDISLFDGNDSTQLENFIDSQPSLGDPGKSTLVSADNELNRLEKQDLVRLASFPELSPNAIIEISYGGAITYINPAANLKFKSLQKEQFNHPILMGLLEQAQNSEGNLLLREVQVNDEVYEQFVHYLSDSKLIRSYIFDITDRKRNEQKLKYQAFHDLLTGLPNRAWFNKQLSLSLEQAKRSKQSMAIVFLDLDEFKNINDTLGHTVGDKVLQNFAQRLTNCVRAGDSVARWGGDEFTLLLPQINDRDDTIKLAQRIVDALREPVEIQDQQIYLKTSLGIAIYPTDGEDGETLLKNADAALYRAKDRGRNCYQFYSNTMTSKASLLLKIEALLHHALKNNELALHYQPQVKLKTGEITGMEALLRWYHKDLGQIAPSKLIPLAEKTDLIIPLAEWTLRTACLQNKAWQDSGFKPLPISVNFSVRQFQQSDFVPMVSRILRETGINPNLLEIEVTESVIMPDESFSSQVFADIKALGVRICLDDFGVGYSSICYLHKFPLNTLKIEQSFIQNLQNSSKEIALASAIMTLGESFGLRVIAEGVETLQQLELLHRLKCQEVQGFWFSRPLPAEDATNLLFEHGFNT
ncbi:MAG: hypothetical protein N5P05_001216 [Chroococcopsis gigantea SAG 12.99]|nr:EAL domain-containing protein [Chlorogloea purpurea SAG 13.99]MDV2999610.1 hypothetical protein [Chroococcopsis gigantea SAG 12.99]